MSNLKILFLSHVVKEGLTETGNMFLKTMLTGNMFLKAVVNNNALDLNYIEIYYKYGFYGAHNYIKEYVNNNGINTIIYYSNPTDFYFDVHFFEKLREENFLVMMTGDTEIYYEARDQYYAQAMDLVAVQDYISTIKLRQIGIKSTSYFSYYDTTKYRRIENQPKNIDVSFIGELMYRVGRTEYIKYLLDNGIHVEIFGPGSPNGQITFEKKIEIINKSKINLDFSGVTEDKRFIRKHQIYKRRKQMKGKCFESTICGSFALIEYAPGLEHYFEIGKEIDVFYNKEELLEKVKYYLAHEEERENIARRGYARAIRDYDVKLAVPKLISTIDELQQNKTYRPSEIYLDDEFIRNYSTFRVLLIIKFIKSGKWKFALEELKIILKYGKLDWYRVRIFFMEEYIFRILGIIFVRFPRIKSVLKLMRGIKK